MKRFLKPGAAVLILLLCFSSLFLSGCNKSRWSDTLPAERDTDELYVMSYNIRTITASPTCKEDRWKNRKEALVGHILSYSPDIVGMQEVERSQLNYLKANLSGYAYFGRSRALTKGLGEGVYIFYRTDRLELVESGHFWLSDTPSKASKGWDAGCNRICVYAKFLDKRTQKTFVHFNTHLDNKGDTARTKGLELILERMKAFDDPIIFTGDFNFHQEDSQYAVAAAKLQDSKYIAENAVFSETNHDYRNKNQGDTPIDYIMLTPYAFTVSDYRVLKEKFDGAYTSDHYAVMVKLKIEQQALRLKVMTYNIRCLNLAPTEPEDNWSIRQDALIAHINQNDADVIGMQEVTGIQNQFLSQNLPQYEKVSQDRDELIFLSEANPIFYKKDKFELISSGTFWLSETPEVMSLGWDGACKRICTYAVLKDKKSGKVFTHFNTHLDHKGTEAREKGAALILERVSAAETPVILTGDFNFNESNPNYTVITAALNDAKYVAPDTMSAGTYHGYDTEDTTNKLPIDFIFVSKQGVAVQSYRVLMEKVDGVFTSDHFAVVSEMEL